MPKPPHSTASPVKRHLEALRDQLLTAQAQLKREPSFALAIIVVGMPTAGRSEVVNQMLEWLDPKHIRVHALDPPTRPQSKPAMWRYWQTLPARGEIAIYFLGWYEDYLTPALHGPKKAQRHQSRVVARIRQLETMLRLDGVRILKLDLRVAKKIQRARIAALRAHKSTRWRVTEEDRWLSKHYDRVRKVTDQMSKATDIPAARWHMIDGADPQRRSLQAAQLVLRELQGGTNVHGSPRRAQWPQTGEPRPKSLPSRPPDGPVDENTYQRELERWQGRLALLTRTSSFRKRSVVLAFEGMDAAGKGGTIRRVTGALDARQYTVVPISAPTPAELAHPYLWRFWRSIPSRGELAIFDRSWYGRVLVERVRGLTADRDWQRAYGEINEFELQLAEAQVIVHKFWLSVGKEEQLQRLEAREQEPLKRFKVDEEDWANRRHFDAYQQAAIDMIERTSTDHAPWTVVPSDDKRFARLHVLKTVCTAIERALSTK